MCETLLRHMAEDVRAGGPCLAALEPHMARNRMTRSPQALSPAPREKSLHHAVRLVRFPGAGEGVDSGADRLAER